MSVSQKLKTDVAIARKALQLEYSFLWDVDLENRIIRQVGEIRHEEAFSEFDAKLTELESQNRKSVTVRINSGGGSVYEALAIIGRMENRKCSNIITECYGHTMSAATAILAAGDKRSMSRWAHFMHHESEYMLEGKHTEIMSEVNQRQREEEQWAKIMEEFTNMPADFWLEEAIGKNLYLDAQQCLELGIIDEIF